jgi:hypothetical protein
MRLPKPFPSFERLIPAIYAFWNIVKGGSETTTKLMDDCVTKIPKVQTNAESVACENGGCMGFHCVQIRPLEPEI